MLSCLHTCIAPLQFNVQQYNRERQREEWELENFPQGEREEVIALCVSQGVAQPDATLVVDTLFKYDDTRTAAAEAAV